MPRKFFKFSRNDAVVSILSLRTLVKQSIILQKSISTMETLKKCSIIDCHENFSNFLAMTRWEA
ncbi:hypothetical protein [Helicobacter rodentium]|uniref:hypothetical protein n=1 Tax=Helicobacter rodentium TaxID=59617 RepID=UPI0023F09C87|nr:hypothetical protein [Helicobacter rodentium]